MVAASGESFRTNEIVVLERPIRSDKNFSVTLSGPPAVLVFATRAAYHTNAPEPIS